MSTCLSLVLSMSVSLPLSVNDKISLSLSCCLSLSLSLCLSVYFLSRLSLFLPPNFSRLLSNSRTLFSKGMPETLSINVSISHPRPKTVSLCHFISHSISIDVSLSLSLSLYVSLFLSLLLCMVFRSSGFCLKMAIAGFSFSLGITFLFRLMSYLSHQYL